MNFTRFPHQLLDKILRLLDIKTLLEIRRVNRFLRLVASEQSLWMYLHLKSIHQKDELVWHKCWSFTALAPLYQNEKIEELEWIVSDVDGLWSDFLYRRWYRENMDISQFFPGSNREICRISATHMHQIDFLQKYEWKRVPIILTNLREFDHLLKWNMDQLAKHHGHTLFEIFSVHKHSFQMSLNNLLRYAHEQKDEDPLYLFDPCFAQKTPTLFASYTVPSVFPDNLQEALGDFSERPNYRWLLIGPMRSGTTWHIDPWGSSAWNLLLSGKKRWALYAPSKIPPGVKFTLNPDPTARNPHIDSCTALEWFLEVLPQLKEEDKPCIEFVQFPGETVFIPCGWWHCVLNLDLTLSVTQNFVSESSLSDTVQILSQGAQGYFANLYPIQGTKIRSLAPRIGTSWLGQWLKSLWEQNPSLRGKLWSFGNAFMFLEELHTFLIMVCDKHQLPTPLMEEAFPYFASSNIILKTSNFLIKMYFHETLLSLCMQQAAEVEALKQIQNLTKEERSGFPELVGQGIEPFTFDKTRLMTPYVVMTVNVGIPLSDTLKRISRDQKAKVARHLGKLMAKFHSLSQPILPSKTPRPTELSEIKGSEVLSSWLHHHLFDSNVAFFQAQEPTMIWTADHDLLTSIKSEKFLAKSQDLVSEKQSLKVQTIKSRFGPWSPFVAFLKWRRSCYSQDLDVDEIPEHLICQLESYLPENVEDLIPIDPKATITDLSTPMLLHGDLTADNILVERSEGPSMREHSTHGETCQVSVVDFGDFSLGDPLYDFLSCYFSSLESEWPSMEEFLRAYWTTCNEKMKNQELVNMWKFQRNFKLSYCAMCYCVLHEDNLLTWLFMAIPELKNVSSWSQIEERVWSILDIWVEENAKSM